MSKPFKLYDKQSKQWHVLYAEETKSQQFGSKKKADAFLKKVKR